MKYKTYSSLDKTNVIRLFEEGKNKCEISRVTGVPRSTLQKWISNKQNGISEPIKQTPEEYLNEVLKSDKKRQAYSFVLGLYLCDGYINKYKTHRSECIKIVNDVKYEVDTLEWAEKLKTLIPENSVSIRKLKSNCKEVKAYSNKLSTLFPQTGSGSKHKRKLTFNEWQFDILKQYPKEFIRACFQSDGSIYTQIVGKYEYKRFAFTNKSEDIIDLFLFCLKLVGIEKEKYWHPEGKFLVQNFKSKQTKILESIISEKK